MNDYERELANDAGLIQVTDFDGGKQSPTSVYSSWKNYDSGNPMGSYGGSGGSQWGNIFKALDASNSWKKGREEKQGYGPWAQGGGGGFGGGGTKIGSGATLWQPPGPGGYQILHSGQQQQSGGGGGGIGGAIKGAASGWLASGGNPIGAVVGGIGGLFG
jgi:hypothetical protein